MTVLPRVNLQQFLNFTNHFLSAKIKNRTLVSFFSGRLQEKNFLPVKAAISKKDSLFLRHDMFSADSP